MDDAATNVSSPLTSTEYEDRLSFLEEQLNLLRSTRSEAIPTYSRGVSNYNESHKGDTKLIPIFRGESGDNEEFKRFVLMFENVSAEGTWSEFHKRAILESKLEGRAREKYFEGVGRNNEISVKERLECLESMFVRIETNEEQENRFYDCKQMQDESVQVFRCRLESFAVDFKRRTFGDIIGYQNILKQQFMVGLKPEIAEKVAVGGELDYQQCVNYAKLIQESLGKYPIKVNVMATQSKKVTVSVEDQLAETTRQITLAQQTIRELTNKIQGLGVGVNNAQVTATSSELSSAQRCDYCKGIGHKESECFKKYPEQSVYFCTYCQMAGHSDAWCRKQNSLIQNPSDSNESGQVNLKGPLQNATNVRLWGTENSKDLGHVNNNFNKQKLNNVSVDYKKIIGYSKEYLNSQMKLIKDNLDKINRSTITNKPISKFFSLKGKVNRKEEVIKLNKISNELPLINVTLNGIEVVALLDTGASFSLVNENIDGLGEWRNTKFTTILQSPIAQENIEARIGKFDLGLGKINLELEACVAPIDTSYEFSIILGFDFFKLHNVILNPSDSCVRISPLLANLKIADSDSIKPILGAIEVNKKEIKNKVLADLENEKVDYEIINEILSKGRDTNNACEVHNQSQGSQIHLNVNKDLSKLVKLKFSKLTKEFNNIFIEDVSKMKGAKIEAIKPIFTSDKPIFVNQYPIPHSIQEILKTKMDAFEKAGIVSRGGSSWNVPLLTVKKSNGDLRIVLDLRKLNEIIEPLPYPMRRIEDILGGLNGSKYFSKIDLNNGFFQLNLDESVRNRFSVSLPWSRYTFNRLPQGCVIAAGAFQRAMNNTLADLISTGSVLVYQDDILVHTATVEKHHEILAQLFNKLKEVNLAARPSKCQFFMDSVTFLGHVVSESGAKPLHDHLTAILDFPRPTTVKQVRSFIGTINFYRKFISNITDKAAPLYELIKKDKIKIVWNEKCEQAFIRLKQDLISAPVLIHPDFSKPFYIKSDASNVAVGGVLEQEVDGSLHPIAYCSRKLNKAERNYACVEREALAIVYALKCFRYLVYGYPIILETDHKPLTFMFKLKESNHRVARWMLQLQDYDIKLSHLAGSLNVVADMLSRGEEVEEVKNIATLRECDLSISMEEIKTQQNKDKNCVEIIKKLNNNCYQNLEYKVDENNLLLKRIFFNEGSRWQFRIIIPETLVNKVIKNYHDPKYGGHFSVKKIFWKIKRLFTWDTMFQDIDKYIKTCNDCQQRNLKRTKAPFQPMSPPSYPFEKISMDIMGPFNLTERGNRYVLLWVDHFTRFPIASAIPTQEASVVAQEYLDRVYSYFGGSKYILSDRGANFTSALFTNMCKKLGVQNLTTTSFRPNSNGVSERSNRTVINILSHICNKNYNDWDLMLPHVMKEIRIYPHASTGESPSYLLYGLDLINPAIEASLPSEDRVYYNEPDYLELLTERIIEARDQVGQHLLKSSQYNCKVRNKNRKLEEYEVGARIWLHDITSHSGKNHKFNKRYKGPYRIIERQGLANYRIRNVNKPNDIQLVHVDRIKRAHDRNYLNDANVKKVLKRKVSHVPPIGGYEDSEEEEPYFYNYNITNNERNEIINNNVETEGLDSNLNIPLVFNQQKQVGLIDVNENEDIQGGTEIIAEELNVASTDSEHKYNTRSKGKLPKDYFQRDGKYLEGRVYNG